MTTPFWENVQKLAKMADKIPEERRKMSAFVAHGYPRPRTLSLKEVLAGCDRAATRVGKWPKWKRDL